MSSILELHAISRVFGGLTAVSELSFQVSEGEIRGLIGPNGAGKTTTFNVISGFYPPSAGSVIYRGRDISGMRTSAIARSLVSPRLTTASCELRILSTSVVPLRGRPTMNKGRSSS